MGARGKILRNYERRVLQRLLRQSACHRHRSTNDHARRLVAPSHECWGHFISFAPPLETGGTLAVLVGRDVVVSLHSTFFRVSFGSLLPPWQNSRKW